MQRNVITTNPPSASSIAALNLEELLNLVTQAESKTRRAKGIADEIENVEEIDIADLVAISSRCHETLSLLEQIKSQLSGTPAPTSPETPPPAAAAVAPAHPHLTLATAA